MKLGDRVEVVAQSTEYSGLHGEILEVTVDGNLVVAIEMKSVMTWRVTFNPHDVELESKHSATRPRSKRN